MAEIYPSLASSTATAIESASKHNLQCRVDTNHIISWVNASGMQGESADNIVKGNQLKYCVHKNDVTIGTRNGWKENYIHTNRAYPLIVSTYSGMELSTQYWLMRMYNNAKDMGDVRNMVYDQLKHRKQGQLVELTNGEKDQIDELPQFYFQGISLGLAYAHPDSGDTVGTVMIGGLRTVLNGHFTANTGQIMQWYFGFEAGLFSPDGERLLQTEDLPDVIEDGMDKLKNMPHNAVDHLSSQAIDRKRWHERENGNFPGYNGKTDVFFLKPYVRNSQARENLLDRERICGVYISSARPFENVDIKLQRQGA